MAEHNFDHNKEKWMKFKLRKPIKYFKRNIKPIFYAYRAGLQVIVGHLVKNS